MIPDIIKSAVFQNMTVKDVTFSRTKPLWFNVNYIVGLTGESKKKMKRFSSKADFRNPTSVLQFCKSIDESECTHCCDSNGVAIADALDSKINDPELEETTTRAKANHTPERTIPLQAAGNPPKSPIKASSVRKIKRISKHWRISVLSKYSEVVKSLGHAILTHSFAGIYAGARVVMETPKGFEFVSDLSQSQTAKLSNEATALRFYYLSMIEKIKAMPWKGSKKNLGNAKRISLKIACRNSIKMSEATMYRLVKLFEKNGYALTESKQGQHERRWLINNEVWATKCKEFIRKEACVKGKPNMTVSDFQIFVNKEIIPNLVVGEDTRGLYKDTFEKGVTSDTARQWLHHLGCYFKEGRKDVYYDGHERPDVIQYRSEFLPRFLHYFEDSDIVLVMQDEVIYKSYECQTAFWHLPENVKTGEFVNNF